MKTTNQERAKQLIESIRHNEQLWLKTKSKKDKAIYLLQINEFSKQHRRFATLHAKEIVARNQWKMDI